MRGSEAYWPSFTASPAQFQIPMRGSERQGDARPDDGHLVFQIPMRGSEPCATASTQADVTSFQIPMRGSESTSSAAPD